MQMTPGEILRSYKEAKDQKEQIQILADMNVTTKEHIVQILIEQGVDGRTLPHPRRPKKQEQPKESMRSVTEHLEVLINPLQKYKQGTMDELERRVNAADATCSRIEAAPAFVREACAR